MIKSHALTGVLLLSLMACVAAKSGGNGINSSAINSGARANAAASDDDHHHSDDGPRVLLTAKGLMTDGSSEGELRFGASRSAALAMVSPIWGPAEQTTNVEDCGGSGSAQQSDWGAVVLFFQNDKLVGWEQRDASETPWIGTPGGASVGLRRPKLNDALGGAMRVEQSSLGTEFSGGGVSGIFASDAADAQVDRMWAGTNCAMR